jgi:phosphoribosylanthranilate isomerase
VRTEIKFCGLTRDEDAAQVGPLGGAYAGVIFAGGPRRVTPERGALVLARLAPEVKKVGVFGDVPIEEISYISRHAWLDIIQLHGDPSPDFVARVREETRTPVWAVVRVTDTGDLAPRIAALDGVANAILLDAPGRLGGSGARFDWDALTPGARPCRSKLVVAGGLTPGNVGDAMGALAPDIVDVSSGVECRRGIKDHERMRAFADAVHRHDQHT